MSDPIRFQRRPGGSWTIRGFQDTEELFEEHEIFDEHRNYLCDAQQLIDEIEGRTPRDYEVDECPCYVCGCTLYRMRDDKTNLKIFRNEEQLHLYQIKKILPDNSSRNIWNLMPVCNSCGREVESSHRGISYSYNAQEEEDLYLDYRVNYQDHIKFLQAVVDQLVEEDDKTRANRSYCLIL